MKPKLIRSQSFSDNSLGFDEREFDFFIPPLHYHPEYELTLIVKSFGQRQIGDNIENFSEGDLVLIGNNLPHVWKNDAVFFSGKPHMKAQAIVVKFLYDFAGSEFFNRSEMTEIRNLLEKKAAFGVKLLGHLRDDVERIMLKLPQLDETERFIQLLQILHLISKSKDYRLLASISYRSQKTKNTHRLNMVLDYVMDHYNEELTLEKIASHISMNKNAFCRFFKTGTHKNLFTVINEVRIGKACQHLTETDMNVLQVCFASGYNNISNFNKVFKDITGMTPLSYRKQMKKFSQANSIFHT